MLRITKVEDGPSRVRLRLEGQIVGEWLHVLERTLSGWSSDPRELELELAGVDFASRGAVALLRDALAGRARLLSCSPYLSTLLGGSGR